MRYRVGNCLSCSCLADDIADNEQKENGGGDKAKLDAGGGFWDIFGFSFHNENGDGLCERKVLVVVRVGVIDVVVAVFKGSVVINVDGERSM